MTPQLVAEDSAVEGLPPATRQALQASGARRLDAVPAGLYLTVDAGRLGLADGRLPRQRPLVVDFAAGGARHRQYHGGGRSQAIARAVGLHQRRELTVIDATAGLGQDAFVLAGLGARVRLLERHGWVRLLLLDGLVRGRDAGVAGLERLELMPAGVELVSPTLASADVVYLDPMFPPGRGKAAVKKAMALFHDLVGRDADADALLSPALARAHRRVVVKRPRLAADLDGREPSYRLTGKSNRFDVYALRSITAAD